MTYTSTEQPEALRLADALTDGRTPSDGLLMTAAAELRRLHARVQELDAAQAQRVPLNPYQVRDIIRKLNANHDQDGWKEGWNFGDLAREVEAAHGITQEQGEQANG